MLFRSGELLSCYCFPVYGSPTWQVWDLILFLWHPSCLPSPSFSLVFGQACVLICLVGLHLPVLDFTHDLELSFGVPFPEPFRSSFHSLCTPCNITLPSFIFPQLLRGCSVSSVLSDSLRSYGLQPVRLLCPWNSPGQNT